MEKWWQSNMALASLLFPYVCILISCDGNELCFWESERLKVSGVTGVLTAVLLHLHHIQPGLVFMQGLHDHHLDAWKERTTEGKNHGRKEPHF